MKSLQYIVQHWLRGRKHLTIIIKINNLRMTFIFLQDREFFRISLPLINPRAPGCPLNQKDQWFGSNHLPERKLVILMGPFVNPCSEAIAAVANTLMGIIR